MLRSDVKSTQRIFLRDSELRSLSGLPVNLVLLTLFGCCLLLLSAPILFITLSFSSPMLSLSRQLCPDSCVRQPSWTSSFCTAGRSRNTSPVHRAMLTTARFLKLCAAFVSMNDSMSPDILSASESIVLLCVVAASSLDVSRSNCFSQMSLVAINALVFQP